MFTLTMTLSKTDGQTTVSETLLLFGYPLSPRSNQNQFSPYTIPAYIIKRQSYENLYNDQ